MNIILIVSDTFRYDHIGVNGNPEIRTPHLDAFAAQCVNFDQAYVGSFPTVPHRTDLLTGHYVYQNRGWSPLPAGEDSLATLLGREGFVNQMVVDHVQLFAPGMNFHRGFHGWQAIRGQGRRTVCHRSGAGRTAVRTGENPYARGGGSLPQERLLPHA